MIYTADGITTCFDQVGGHASIFCGGLVIGHQASASSLALPVVPSVFLRTSNPAIEEWGLVTQFENVVGSCPPARVARTLHGGPEVVVISALDASAWSSQPQTFTLLDETQSDSRTLARDGWKGAIQTGFSRWSAARPMELVDLRWSMAKSVTPRRSCNGNDQVGQPFLFVR